jgi:UDP-N-acetylmuramoyl-tripeptide--D-alanyl-D-alanine ligase
VEKNRERFSQGRFIAVDDPLQALQDAAAFYRQKFKIPLLAITGSNGKTTTKEMVAAVLSRRMKVVKNRGNLNNHIGLPLALFGLTHETEVAVVEMGANHFGEIARLCEIAKPDFGLITNVGRAHLEYFGSVDDVAQAKSKLFSYLEENAGLGFVNVDDPRVEKIARRLKRSWSYGFSREADVRGTWVGLDEQGRSIFRVSGAEIHLSVVGEHQAQNALAAVAVGLFFNLPLAEVKKALKEFSGVDKRLEVFEAGGVLVLNDTYNANPNSVEQALKTLAHLHRQRGGRSFAVLGDMLELGPESEASHRQVGNFVARSGVNFLLTVGEQAHFIQQAAAEKGGTRAVHFAGKDELQDFLLQNVRKGDLVLVKGSRGMKMETVVEFLRRELTDHSPEE